MDFQLDCQCLPFPHCLWVEYDTDAVHILASKGWRINANIAGIDRMAIIFDPCWILSVLCWSRCVEMFSCSIPFGHSILRAYVRERTVYLVYPETAQLSLEEMDRLFSDSPPPDVESASLIRSALEDGSTVTSESSFCDAAKRSTTLSRQSSASIATSTKSHFNTGRSNLSWSPFDWFRSRREGVHSRSQPQQKDYQSVSRDEMIQDE